MFKNGNILEFKVMFKHAAYEPINLFMFSERDRNQKMSLRLKSSAVSSEDHI